MDVKFFLNNKKYVLIEQLGISSICYKIILPSNKAKEKKANIIKWEHSNKILFFKVNETIYKAKVIKTEKNQIELYIFNFKKSFQISLGIPNSFVPAQKTNLDEVKQIDDSFELTSPICGRIIKINVKPNQFVKKNQTLIIIESMKMENEIKAKTDAFVKTILISLYDLVKQNQILMKFTKKGKKDGTTKNTYAKTSI